ncbi:hypothetical protein Q3G72_024048 [Acer saccharum]|nr:hypothetical protein Q3G72_024048 [Acer saccharum]
MAPLAVHGSGHRSPFTAPFAFAVHGSVRRSRSLTFRFLGWISKFGCLGLGYLNPGCGFFLKWLVDVVKMKNRCDGFWILDSVHPGLLHLSTSTSASAPQPESYIAAGGYSRLVAGFSADETLLVGFAIKSLGRAWTLTILAAALANTAMNKAIKHFTITIF